MITAHDFIVNLAVVLGVAALTSVLTRLARQPLVLGYLVAGLIVGPHVSIPVLADAGMVRALSELGVILLMFSLGLELSLRKVLQLAPRAGAVAAIEMGVVGWLVFGALRLAGWSVVEAAFGGAAMAISSTMVIARTFREQKLRSPFTELVYGVLIFEDLAAVLLITVLTPVATGLAPEAEAMAMTLVRLATFVAGFLLVGVLLVPRAVRAVARTGSSETLLVASVGLCFVAAAAADAAGYSVALGAFLAGALVAESGAARRIEPLVEPLRDVFGAVFFVSVGLLIDPRTLFGELGTVLLVVLVVVLGKAIGVTLGAVLADGRFRPSFRAGLSMTQVGEFSFIIIGVGLWHGAFGPELLAVAVGVSAMTTCATPWLVRGSDRASSAVYHRLPAALHTLLTLYGSWLERLRTAERSTSSTAEIRRTIFKILVDCGCIIAIAVAMRVIRPSAVELLDEHTPIARDFAQTLLTLATITMLVPFGVGIFRLGRSLGERLAALALPPPAPGTLDLAGAARHAFHVVLQVAVLAGIGAPLLAIVQPFLPVLGPLALVAVALGVVSALIWRRMTNLDGHVRASAEVVLEALARQVQSPEEKTPDEALEEVSERLPGMGEIAAIHIAADSPAAGRSLLDLDVEATTGATVIAIHSGSRVQPNPGPEERCAEGDLVIVFGSHAAVTAAHDLLERGLLPGEQPEEEVPDE